MISATGSDKSAGTTTLSTRVDPMLHRAVRVRAAENGETVAELVSRALWVELARDVTQEMQEAGASTPASRPGSSPDVKHTDR